MTSRRYCRMILPSEAAERERQRECAREELSTKRQPDWSDVQLMVDAAIAHERRLLCESLGDEVGRLLAEERQETSRVMRNEIRELKIEIAKLNNEAATLREALALERSAVDPTTPAISRRVN
jgi:hypothetical protein